MKKTLLATTAGLLLMACGGMQKPGPAIEPPPALAPGDQTITSLERACLSDPMNAAKWEGLAAALATDGQRERALRMYEQAATLHAHDARRDYALLQAAGATAAAAAAAAAAAVPAAAPAPSADPLASLPRTEVRQIGASLVAVLRVAPTPVPAPAPAPMSTQTQTQTPAPVRLEISNGNGVTGAAARLARSLSVDGLKTVRLTNVKNFDVPLSRIEYRQEQQRMAESLSERLGLPLEARDDASPRADMRIVLGHDAAPASRFK